MNKTQATDIIRQIADHDYDGTEPTTTLSDARAFLQAASRPGYCVIEDAPEAIKLLGLDAAAQIYIEALAEAHNNEYAQEEEV